MARQNRRDRLQRPRPPQEVGWSKLKEFRASHRTAPKILQRRRFHAAVRHNAAEKPAATPDPAGKYATPDLLAVRFQSELARIDGAAASRTLAARHAAAVAKIAEGLAELNALGVEIGQQADASARYEVIAKLFRIDA
jgi:hypothetical protein